MIRADAVELDVKRVKSGAGIDQHGEGLDLIVGLHTGQPNLADAGGIAASGFHIQRYKAETAFWHVVRMSEHWSCRGAYDLRRPIFSSGLRLIALRRFGAAAEKPVENCHAEITPENTATDQMLLVADLSAQHNPEVRAPDDLSWCAQLRVLEGAGVDQARLHVVQPSGHPSCDFEVLLEVVDQFVVGPEQHVMSLCAFGDVGFAGEAFVVALIAVETGCVLMNAHAAAGTYGFAVSEACAAVVITPKISGVQKYNFLGKISEKFLMKTARFSGAKIRGILKQAEGGKPVSALCLEHGTSSASFYKWRARFGGMDASLVAEMKDMGEQNRRLKRMYAEMSMQNDLLTEALGKSV
jgi:putative transposase